MSIRLGLLSWLGRINQKGIYVFMPDVETPSLGQAPSDFGNLQLPKKEASLTSI